MSRTNPPTPKREPSCRVVDILARRWTIAIIVALSAGAERFGTLQRRLPGVVHKVLTEQLRFLERVGVVERIAYGTATRSLYRLSRKGMSLLPLITAMQALEQQWCAQYDDGSTDHPVGLGKRER